MSKEKKEPQNNVETVPSTELKDCFIITPIGIIGSETYKKAHGLIKSVIAPVLLEFGFRALPAYEISAAGSITKQVIEHVINDDLVIANLTGLNPNVMYELALRHAYKKKVITMAEDGTKLPFDISDQRTLFYDDNLYGSMLAKPLLYDFIKEALENEVSSNPVIDSVKEAAVISQSGEDSNQTEYMIKRLDRLERILTSRSGYPKRQVYNTTEDGIRSKYMLTISFQEEASTQDHQFQTSVVELSKSMGISINYMINDGQNGLKMPILGSEERIKSFARELLNNYKGLSYSLSLMA